MFFTLHKEDNGSVVTAKKGDRVVVSLDEHPHKISKWLWVANAALELVDESKKTEDNDTQLRVFRFGVLDSAVDITFNLEDPFHVDVPADTFKFSVVVQ